MSGAFNNQISMTPEQAIALMAREEFEELGGWEPKLYDDIITLKQRRILVASDVHYPKHDKEMLEGMLKYASQAGIEIIAWGGDFFDVEEYSRYGVDDHTSSFQRNLRAGAAVMRTVARMGIKQVWSQGNHEARVFRGQHQLNMTSLALIAGLQDLIDADALIISDNPTIYLEIGNWMVTHPSQYGSFPLVVASKLATRFQKNTIVAHEHHWGMSTDETGEFIAISSGGLFDPRKHKYINRNVTSHRAWAQGFVTVIDGQAQLFRRLPIGVLGQTERVVESGR